MTGADIGGTLVPSRSLSHEQGMAMLDTPFLLRFFAVAASRLEDARADLCALDGEIGDGDHGTSMANGFAAISALSRQPRVRDLNPGALMHEAAGAFLSDVGATVGPLYAGAMLQVAHMFGNKLALPLGEVDKLIASFAEGIAARGKARQGDKTMLDAWLPAAHAAQEAAHSGASPGEVLRRAQVAARDGSSATAAMIACRGRAAHLKERSIGHRDPGAVSATLIVEALALAYAATADNGVKEDPRV